MARRYLVGTCCNLRIAGCINGMIRKICTQCDSTYPCLKKGKVNFLATDFTKDKCPECAAKAKNPRQETYFYAEFLFSIRNYIAGLMGDD